MNAVYVSITLNNLSCGTMSPLLKSAHSNIFRDAADENAQALKAFEKKILRKKLGAISSIAWGRVPHLTPFERAQTMIDYLLSFPIEIDFLQGRSCPYSALISAFFAQKQKRQEEYKAFMLEVRALLYKRFESIQLMQIEGVPIRRKRCPCCLHLFHIEVVPCTESKHIQARCSWNAIGDEVELKIQRFLMIWPHHDHLEGLIMALGHEMVHCAREHYMQRLLLERNKHAIPAYVYQLQEVEADFVALALLGNEHMIKHFLCWLASNSKNDGSDTHPSNVFRIQIGLHYWIVYSMKRDQLSLSQARNYVAREYKKLIDTVRMHEQQQIVLSQLAASIHMPTLEQLLWSVVSPVPDGSKK